MYNDNVWANLKTSETIIVAEKDRKYINDLLNNFNYDSFPKKEKLDFSVLPLHYIGDIEKSKILVLSLNPGIDEKYKKEYNEREKKGLNFAKKIENNLNFNDPDFFEFDYYEVEKEGYWKRLRPLFAEEYDEMLRISSKSLENKSERLNELKEFFTRIISLVEFFPYHSAKYNEYYDKLCINGKKKDYLPSQLFVFDIIKERINNENDDVLIIITRSHKKWIEAIPELATYDCCYILSNPQNPSFKPENIYKKKIEVNKGSEIIEKIKLEKNKE
jgi:hypothetical protein